MRHDGLAALLILFTAVAAASGVLVPDVYRDNLLVRSGWYGNDLVTLVVAAPLLTIASRRARRGNLRATMLWLGLLAYTVYRYAFYVFGASFNQLFLVYVAILVLSALGLIHRLASPADRAVLHGVVIRGVWLWRRRPWGFVIAALWMVRGAVSVAALSAAAVAAFTGGAATELSQPRLRVPGGAGCAIGSFA